MSTASFCTSIAERTQAAHRSAESHLFIRSLMAGQLDVRSLVLLFEALLPVYEELECSARQMSDDTWVGLFDHRLLDRAPRLRDDLRRLGRTSRAPVGPGTGAYVDVIRASAESPQRFLAHHYTRYLGDLAGGQAISRLVQRHYAIGAEFLTYYDVSDLGDPVHYRRQYRALLDLLPWSPTEQAEFITECQVAFEATGRVFDDLARSTGLLTRTDAPGAGFLASERAHVRTSTSSCLEPPGGDEPPRGDR